MNVVYFQQIYAAGKLLAGKRDERVKFCDEIYKISVLCIESLQPILD